MGTWLASSFVVHVPVVALLVLTACSLDATPMAGDASGLADAAAEDGPAPPGDGPAPPGDAASPADGPPTSGWVDPYGPLPAVSTWAGTATTSSGVVIWVNAPAGDTASSMLVIGAYDVERVSPSDGAVTIAIQGTGSEPGISPGTCGSLSGVTHIPDGQFVEVLHEVGPNLRFDHRRVFLEADDTSAGWALMAGLGAAEQAYVTGIYEPWCEYNQCPVRSTLPAATELSPRLYLVGPDACDDTYCPWRHATDEILAAGYDAEVLDGVGPASCPCDGDCPTTERPHFAGPGPAGGILAWVTSLSR